MKELVVAQCEEEFDKEETSHQGLKDRVKQLEDRVVRKRSEIESLRSEKTLLMPMMRGICRRVRFVVDYTGLGRIPLVTQDKDTLGHLVAPLGEIANRLEKLPDIVHDLATREGHGLAFAVAEHVLMFYHSWDSGFPLEPARLGVDPKGEEATRAAVSEVAKHIAQCFTPGEDTGTDVDEDAGESAGKGAYGGADEDADAGANEDASESIDA